MLLGSFYSGLSGLQANATALNVVGNNLANINTTGFKRSQTNFGQIMSNTVSGINGVGNPIQIGLGVRTTEIVAKFEQGSIQTTGIKTHLAIQGEGFYQVKRGGTSSYTRSGNFGFNEEGFLVAANGGRVQGFLGTNADGTVNTDGDLTDIKIDLGEASPPRATTLVRFISNLSAEAAAGETYSTSIEVFDSKGVAHQVGVTFTKDAADGVWQYQFNFDDAGATITGGNDTTGGGYLHFASDGTLLGHNNTPATPPDPNAHDAGTLNFNNGTSIVANTAANGSATPYVNPSITIAGVPGGADDLVLEFDLDDAPTEAGAPNGSFFTSFGSLFNTGTLFQDGFGSGVLQDIDFDQDGTMIGFYDNGQTLELARIALATFNNKLGLKQIDGGYYLSTAASGPASVDGEGTGGRGSIISSSLESSNVDIAEEFTALIVHQRGYQSNSRTITTTDQLLQDALSLKR